MLEIVPDLLVNLLASGMFLGGEKLYSYCTINGVGGPRTFRVRNATRSELDSMRIELSQFTLDNNLLDIRKIEENHSWEPSAYKVLEPLDKKSNKYGPVAGYFVVHKMKKSFTEDMISGKKTIQDLGKDDVHRRGDGAYGYYISFIHAKSRIGRGYLANAVYDHIFSRERRKGPQYIITRPGPVDAVKFCKRVGMKGLHHRDVVPHEICYRILPPRDDREVKKILKRIKTYRLSK